MIVPYLIVPGEFARKCINLTGRQSFGLKSFSMSALHHTKKKSQQNEAKKSYSLALQERGS